MKTSGMVAPAFLLRVGVWGPNSSLKRMQSSLLATTRQHTSRSPNSPPPDVRDGVQNKPFLVTYSPDSARLSNLVIDARPPPIFVGDTRALDFLNSIATPVDTAVEWLSSGSDL